MWTNISEAPFLLTGFPGLQIAHHQISIPFLAAYDYILFGNGALLYLIKDDQSLQKPMYYFLAMLAGTDIMGTLTTMLTEMGILWVNHREISHAGCFLQAYFIHSISIVESDILLAMAYDHFIAIHNPFRYASQQYSSGKVRSGDFSEGFVLIRCLIVRLFSFSYCHSHVLSHAFCLQDIMKLACADITFNKLYPVILICLTTFLDFLIILFSYILILRTILGIASGEERAKALNTCISHISSVLIFFGTGIGLSLIHRLGRNVPEVVHIIMRYAYFRFPLLMNPFIYSIKIKQIHYGLIHLFSKHRFHS
ncbi:olfactory receptor 51B2-like [Nycticebus coucang]|uniref:olfactory receptor 51B2-like n=1 Tax=Nycticebus coucang TaxID=9470 RepID=UPI00234D5CB3|nr:olfactory receptor 51B2-like [Nycticebus coucang]